MTDSAGLIILPRRCCSWIGPDHRTGIFPLNVRASSGGFCMDLYGVEPTGSSATKPQPVSQYRIHTRTLPLLRARIHIICTVQKCNSKEGEASPQELGSKAGRFHPRQRDERPQPDCPACLDFDTSISFALVSLTKSLLRTPLMLLSSMSNHRDQQDGMCRPPSHPAPSPWMELVK
ncbi:hypothetical protein CIHG_02782 [Coccidioides immitis H538.4]|uniref:Uncharacterized protein n=3 Tax=Coccidioides immitis TaxID=5501 RepID=A0A0J8TDY7_COCIT|nr:hypothetical protein CIRG_07498 [Coccidioides immitis RMSCC 2394]KMU71722.1 hypothetical protein CISG_00032 [Coccidioides immitis RMSCC 3703]KMU84999.1 hypothetical protein CIHG_02782 [Coccidioides immitis H538.4]